MIQTVLWTGLRDMEWMVVMQQERNFFMMLAGLTGYRGIAQQNTILLKWLKQHFGL